MREPVFTDTTQIAIVVHDLEATVQRWVDDYGIGPWEIHDINPKTMSEMTRNGEPAEHAFRVAVATIGRTNWELIQPLDDRSSYAEFLSTRGQGVHHVSMEVADFKAAVETMEASGRRVLQGGTTHGITHAYMSTNDDIGVITEIYDRPAEAVPQRPAEAIAPQ